MPEDEDEVYFALDVGCNDDNNNEHIDEDQCGQHVELCFTEEMANAILRRHQEVSPGTRATLRVYLSNTAKRAVVVKDDDLLTQKEMHDYHKEVAAATLTELKNGSVTHASRNAFSGTPKTS